MNRSAQYTVNEKPNVSDRTMQNAFPHSALSPFKCQQLCGHYHNLLLILEMTHERSNILPFETTLDSPHTFPIDAIYIFRARLIRTRKCHGFRQVDRNAEVHLQNVKLSQHEYRDSLDSRTRMLSEKSDSKLLDKTLHTPFPGHDQQRKSFSARPPNETLFLTYLR
ncbi:hypothetical protein TcasGA2_TC004485 [Tribolium castaneum]|uniref:Uncharacterized protein n=1 Tax=Tribolium castaneum TaxID=7070 RepID=D6WCH2_TRICA|nr:hypothetical protein TcasGA2_TC004485 [Tribolium castaneum]